MCGKNLIFDNKKIKTTDFYKTKKVFKIDDIDVNKILVSKKESSCTKSSFKYFIGYNDGVIRLLYIKLPQMMGMLNTLKVLRQCLLKSLRKNFYKSILTYEKK